MWTAEISSLEEWQSIAHRVAAELKHPILLLKGNLGAGKTTFTQYLLKELGSKDKVTSPTYSIVNEYNSPEGKIFHFDLYRLDEVDEVYDIGIEEYLGSGRLSIIEWPEIFEEEIYDAYHEMKIDNAGSIRSIKFK